VFVAVSPCVAQLPRKVCYKETRKRGGRKRGEIKQETERHTQGAHPATQADTEHSRGGKSHAGAQNNRNREKQQPHTAQSRTSLATRTDTNRIPAPGAQVREKSSTRARAQACHGGAGKTLAPAPAKPRQRGDTQPTSAEGESATGRYNK
jgi:hypothetical protein